VRKRRVVFVMARKWMKELYLTKLQPATNRINSPPLEDANQIRRNKKNDRLPLLKQRSILRTKQVNSLLIFLG